MLILGRKTDESIIIGDDIIVTILAIEGERVKIGIQAPPHVRILRLELSETGQKDKDASTEADDNL